MITLPLSGAPCVGVQVETFWPAPRGGEADVTSSRPGRLRVNTDDAMLKESANTGVRLALSYLREKCALQPSLARCLDKFDTPQGERGVPQGLTIFTLVFPDEYLAQDGAPPAPRSVTVNGESGGLAFALAFVERVLSDSEVSRRTHCWPRIAATGSLRSGSRRVERVEAINEKARSVLDELGCCEGERWFIYPKDNKIADDVEHQLRRVGIKLCPVAELKEAVDELVQLVLGIAEPDEGRPSRGVISRRVRLGLLRKRWLNPWITPLLGAVLGVLVLGGVTTFIIGNSSQQGSDILTTATVNQQRFASIPTTSPTIQSEKCLSNPKRLSVIVSGNEHAHSEELITSPRCRDINVRFISLPETTEVRAIQCSRQGNWYSNWHIFHPSDTGWEEIATNMRDGVCFQLEMRSTSGKTYPATGDIDY